MSAANRTVRITKLVSSLKKHFKPMPAPPKDRSGFETLVYACLLENSPHDAADKAFATLKSDYFDWNEVRVSTRRELAEAIKHLTDPEAAADRVKLALQSVFETLYVFDIEPLKKQTLGQAVATVQKYKGMTPFVLAYMIQNALGGHAIPVNKGLLVALHTFDIITDVELAKATAPGLERAIPKNKGVEVGSQMHQLGVEVGKNPHGPAARKLLLEIDPACKDRLPKKPAPPAPEPPPAPAKADAKKATIDKKEADKKAAAKKPAAKKPEPAKPEVKKPEAKKPEAKAPEPKKPAAAAKVEAKKPDSKKPEPKKPEVKKPEVKKPVPKKPEPKKPAAKPPAPKKPAPPVKKKTSTRLAKKKPR